MTISFANKVAIVTGAGGGLGRAHAQPGWRLVHQHFQPTEHTDRHFTHHAHSLQDQPKPMSQHRHREITSMQNTRLDFGSQTIAQMPRPIQ